MFSLFTERNCLRAMRQKGGRDREGERKIYR